MRNIRSQFSLALASILGAGVLVVVPVSAQHGGSTTSGDNTTTSNSTESGNSSSGTETETEVHTANVVTGSTDDKGGLRDQAKSLLDSARQKGKQHTSAQRKTACQAHAAEIDKRSKNYATAAQRHLDVFNGIFTKVQAFHDSKQLNVTDYDTLLAAANAKKTAAQTAVDNLAALDVSIDCTSTDPASTVATLKTAVGDARTALHDYRKAIKDLVVALKGASTAQSSTDNTDTSTTGGTQ